MTGTLTRRPASLAVRRAATTLLAGTELMAIAAGAWAQGAGTHGGPSQAVVMALVLVAVLPFAEALFYRLHVGVRFLPALGVCALLNLAAYGATVVWVLFVPGGANPWFAALVGAAARYSAAQIVVAAVLYAAVFLAVKVPVLSMWLGARIPGRRLTVTVLLINLVLFFALSAAISLLVDSAAL